MPNVRRNATGNWQEVTDARKKTCFYSSHRANSGKLADAWAARTASGVRTGALVCLGVRYGYTESELSRAGEITPAETEVA